MRQRPDLRKGSCACSILHITLGFCRSAGSWILTLDRRNGPWEASSGLRRIPLKHHD